MLARKLLRPLQSDCATFRKKPDAPLFDQPANFSQDIVYDTNAIRRELNYREEIPERDAMRDLCRKSVLAEVNVRSPNV